MTGPGPGTPRGQLLPVIIALVVTLLMRAVANVNRLSMHDFYRWRLADAFAVTREAAEADAAGTARDKVREKFAQATATRLSELTSRDQSGPGHLWHGQHQRAPAGTARAGRVLRHVRPGATSSCTGRWAWMPERCQGPDVGL